MEFPTFTEVSTVRMAQLRKGLVFGALVAVMVVFGGGRIEGWLVICEDPQGYVYELEKDSIQTWDSNEVSLRVRALKDSAMFESHWVFASDGRTVRRDDLQPELVEPGSVAFHFVVYLRSIGKLPLATFTGVETLEQEGRR